MEEQFDTFDEADQPTGLMSRSFVHANGIWHRAANVFLFRTDGRLIIQRRHSKKDIWPNAWDLSAAEHLQSGESFLQGAIRGVQEELGISGVDLEPVGDAVRYQLDDPGLNIKDFEIQMSFRGITDASISFQTDEVAEVKIVELKALKAEIQKLPQTFTPWFRERANDIGLFKNIKD